MYSLLKPDGALDFKRVASVIINPILEKQKKPEKNHARRGKKNH
jgi:hypothetical protein